MTISLITSRQSPGRTKENHELVSTAGVRLLPGWHSDSLPFRKSTPLKSLILEHILLDRSLKLNFDSSASEIVFPLKHIGCSLTALNWRISGLRLSRR